LYNDVYFAVGLLVGLVFMLAIAVIVACLPTIRRREARGASVLQPQVSPALGVLRANLKELQHRLNDLLEELSSFGITEERKAREWRLLSVAVAEKAALALQSYWMESRNNPEVESLYQELFQSLRTLGMQEVLPHEGQEVDEDDGRFRFNTRAGNAPLHVERVVCPGFLLDIGRQRHLADAETRILVLEPAIVDVRGRGETQL
jgi:hypothetical protein